MLALRRRPLARDDAPLRLRAGRADAAPQSGRRRSRTRPRARRPGCERQGLRGALAAAQMALAVLLLLGAGLMLRSLAALLRVDLGFEPRHVLTLQVRPPEASYREPESVVAFYRALLDRVRALPGVRAAGIVRSLPLAAEIGDWGLDVEGYVGSAGHAREGRLAGRLRRRARGARRAARCAAVRSPRPTRRTRCRSCSSTRRSRGRTGRARTRSAGACAWARRKSAVDEGRRASARRAAQRRHGRDQGEVLRSVRAVSERARRRRGPGHDHRRSHGRRPDDARRARSAREVRALDPSLPVANARRMTDVVDASLATPRLTGTLLAIFAGPRAAARRRRSRRRARRTSSAGAAGRSGSAWRSGPRGPDVLGLVVRRGVAYAARSGIAVGAVAALFLSQALSGLLYGVAPRDPATFAVVVAILLRDRRRGERRAGAAGVARGSAGGAALGIAVAGPTRGAPRRSRRV